jgi:hypothetical protein
MSLQNIEKSDSKNTKEGLDRKAVLDPNEEIFEPHEEMADESEMTAKATPFVYLLVVCVCVGGFLFGYDTGGKQFKYLPCNSLEKLIFCVNFYSDFWCLGFFT